MPTAVSGDSTSDLSAVFTVRELQGFKRTLRLRERALPYRPFELGGSQRNQVDWYPGSPIGTIQVFGAKEEQTTVTGMWKDKFLGFEQRGAAPAEMSQSETELITPDGDEVTGARSDALTTARDLVEAVDSIRRSGSEVEVTWLGFVRRGILEKLTQKWHTGHDCEWEVMFTWSSQGESLADVRTTDNNATDVGDVPNKVQGLFDQITSTASDVVGFADDRSADILQAFDDVSSKIGDLSDDLVDAVVNVSAVITTPAQAARRTSGILEGIKDQAVELHDIIVDELDAAALDASGSGTVLNPTSQGFGTILGIRANARARADSCDQLADLCVQQQQLLSARLTSPTVRAFVARDGQDLRDVALRSYGTSDTWRGLMLFNHLKQSGLAAGQLVLVPASPPDGTSR